MSSKNSFREYLTESGSKKYPGPSVLKDIPQGKGNWAHNYPDISLLLNDKEVQKIMKKYPDVVVDGLNQYGPKFGGGTSSIFKANFYSDMSTDKQVFSKSFNLT